MTSLLPADFTQPSLQIFLRINLDGTLFEKTGRSLQLKGGELFAILQKSLFRVSYLSPIGNCNDCLL